MQLSFFKFKNYGFTLIELLAVLVIMGIIALLVIPNINNIIQNSKESSIKDSLNSLVKAADNYYNINVFDVPLYGEPMEFKDIKVLLDEGYINSIPDNTEGIFFIVYTSSDIYKKQVILLNDNKYYSSIENLGSSCSLY